MGEPGFEVIIDGADVGADIVDSADDDEDEAARRGDLDFVPILNIILLTTDANKGAPGEGKTLAVVAAVIIVLSPVVAATVTTVDLI